MDEAPNSTNPLDQIESEIRDIDQMIHSWSHGRSLRFDPAHVSSNKEQPSAPADKSKSPIYSVGRLFFWFNLLAFSLPIGLLAFQSLAKALSPKVEAFILTISMMILAGGNLVLAAFESSRIKIQSGEKQPRIRNSRTQPSVRSNT